MSSTCCDSSGWRLVKRSALWFCSSFSKMVSCDATTCSGWRFASSCFGSFSCCVAYSCSLSWCIGFSFCGSDVALLGKTATVACVEATQHCIVLGLEVLAFVPIHFNGKDLIVVEFLKEGPHYCVVRLSQGMELLSEVFSKHLNAILVHFEEIVTLLPILDMSLDYLQFSCLSWPLVLSLS